MGKDISIFEKMVKLLKREEINAIASRHKTGRYVKRFDTWSHLVTLIYCQLTTQKSLRELVLNFNQSTALLTKLKVTNISRSTVSDANNQRRCDVFKEIFTNMLPYVCRKYRQDLQEGIYLIDATPITLQEKMFDWVMRTKRIKGLKTHVMYELQTGVPVYFSMSNPNVNDIEVAKKMVLKKGVSYVFDRGYYDFEWWDEINESGSRFVTRAKKSLKYKKIEGYETCAPTKLDEHIYLEGRSGKKYSGALRLIQVEIKVRKKKKTIRLLTNDLHSTADELAQLYRLRWQIELFFKWIKSNLKIKAFISRSRTAIETQIIAAFITYILIRITYDALKTSHTLKEFLSIIRYNIGQSLNRLKLYNENRRTIKSYSIPRGGLEHDF
jgi:putative transposase